MFHKIARVGFLFAGFFFGIFLSGGGGVRPAHGAELVYFHSKGCSYCELWDRQVGPIYPKTDESKVLPLRTVDFNTPFPSDIKFIKGVVYTPTFVAIENGKEIGRIVGYPGDNFFWARLDQLVKKVPHHPLSAGTSVRTSCSGAASSSTQKAC